MTTVSPRYARVLVAVDHTPHSATHIYRRWAELPEWKSLTRRQRNERKWVGQVLENLAADGLIRRGVITESDRTWVGFWKPANDQTGVSP